MWKENDDYLEYISEYYIYRPCLYMFDVDGTLITTKTGRKPYLIKSPDDFVFFDSVFPKLKKLSKRYSFILVSNQAKFTDIIAEKFELLTKCFEENKIEIICFILKSKEYKKPSNKIFQRILKLWKKSNIILEKIKISGDAIGETSEFPPYRWADSDLKFYENINFLKKSFVSPLKLFPSKKINNFSISEKEMILCVGNPGSGKSECANYFEKNGYQVISGDRKQTKKKQNDMLKEFLNKNESIVIDNTNSKKENRRVFVNLAREYDYYIRVIWCIRDGRPFNAEREHPVPEVAYSIYSKYFNEPSIPEDGDVIEQFY